MHRGIPTLLAFAILALALGAATWWLGAKNAPSPDPAPPASQPATAWDPARLNVLTANIRISEPTDGINIWPNRRELLVKTLLKYNPDLLGCQEVTPAQGAYLIKELAPWYTHYPRAGVGKTEGGGRSRTAQLLGEVTASFSSLNTLFYRTDRFDQLDGESGLILPNDPQSNPTENAFFTLAVLREKSPAHPTFIVIDTHLRHNEAVAVKGARQLRENAAAWLKKYPTASVIIMGDMNHDRTEPAYRALIGQPDSPDHLPPLNDSFDYSLKKPNERWGNWHAFTGKPRYEWPSDLILTTGNWSPTDTRFIRDAGPHGLWPSDHFFVETTLVQK